MKRVFALWLLTLVVKVSIGQDTIQPLSFSEVVKVDSSLTKDQLFASARTWFNEEFKSFKDVNQITDKETGEITIKGIIYTRYLVDGFGSPHAEWPCNTKCQISVLVKDGRYKYEFSNFRDECLQNELATLGLLTTSSERLSKGYMHKVINGQWVELKGKVETIVHEMIERLKVAMTKSQKKDDW